MKIIACIGIVIILLTCNVNVFAISDALDGIAEEIKLDNMIKELNGITTADINLKEIFTSLVKGDNTNFNDLKQPVIQIILNLFKVNISTVITMFIVMVMVAIITSLDVAKDSHVTKTCNLVCFIVLATIGCMQYLEITDVFKQSVSNMGNVLTIISPVLMGLLIATGGIVTSGIISPSILAISTITSNIIYHIIIPMISLSIVLGIITGIGSIKFEKLSKNLNKWAIGIVAVILTVFLTFIELQSAVSISAESVGFKTTQTIIGNVVPVVGGFVSDSLEVVYSASEVIGKAVGVIGIIAIAIIVLTPIITIGIYSLCYQIIECIAQALGVEEKLITVIQSFANATKTIFGLLIAISAMYIISFGIVIGLMGKIMS